MANPRTVGEISDLPSGTSSQSEQGIEPDFANVDHLHQLWTPWQVWIAGPPFGAEYSLCPPLIQWWMSLNPTPSPIVNPIATGNPYPPQLDVVASTTNGFYRFLSNGEIRLVNFDLTDPLAPSPGVCTLEHFTYRYDDSQ